MGERGLLYTHLLTKQEEGTSSEWSGIKHVEAEKEVNVVDTTVRSEKRAHVDAYLERKLSFQIEGY